MSRRRHALLIGINHYPYAAGANLEGTANDVLRIGTLLRDRFGFPENNLHILIDAEATQAKIRAAFDDMAERTGAGDVVVCFYSGHGSRMAHPGRQGEMLESIVAHDSGRGKYSNRDLPDVEIDRWVQRLNERTPFVTLIFDCCHSGSVTRDAFGTAVRGLTPDLRMPEEMFVGGAVPASLLTAARSPRRGADKTPPVAGDHGGYFRGRRRAVTIAACRADEFANEHLVAEGGRAFCHGALTYFLGRALERAPAGATWRDVFEQVGPAVTSRYQRQHPQVEGDWDQVLFGTHQAPPAPYLRVVGLEGRRLELSAGAVHGVSHGSQWSIRPRGARHGAAGDEIARVAVESVASALSKARTLEAEDAARLAVGQRAFLRVERLAEPALVIRSAVNGDHATELRNAIADSPLLRPAAGDEPADVLVRCSSSEPYWTALGTDGRLAVRRRPAEHGAAAHLAGDLESLVRYQGLLAISNPPSVPLRGNLRKRVRLLVLRAGPDGTLVAAESQAGDGVMRFADGETLDFEIHNDGEKSLWITLLHFGCDVSIARLVPLPRHPTYRPGGYRLAGGEVLKVGDYYRRDPRFQVWSGFQVQLPDGFPWAAEPGEEPVTGLVHLKLMITEEPADFEVMEQQPSLGAPDTRDLGPRSHPLLELVRLYGSGQGERAVAVGSADCSSQWATMTRAIAISRSSR